MRIVKRRLDRWDEVTLRRLRHATLQGGYLKKYMRAFPDSSTIVMFANQQVVGWAFALIHTNNDIVTLNLYINERYRGKGYAQILVEEALKEYPMIILIAWNETTRKLFVRLHGKYSGRIVVIDWWKNRHTYDEILLREGVEPPA